MNAYEEAAAWIASYDPSQPPVPPSAVDSAPWIGSVAGVLHTIRNGQELSPHALRARLTANLGTTASLSATVAAMLAGPPRPALWSLSAVLLSSTEPEAIEVEDAVQEAAVVLCREALTHLTGTQAVPVAIRLARIAEQTGDDAEAARAWAIAMGHDPLVAWALSPSEWRLPGQPDPEAVALAQATGGERSLRETIARLRSDASATNELDALVPKLWQARLVRAVEYLRVAAQGSSEEGREAAELALATVAPVSGGAYRSAATMVEVLAELLRGRRDAAAAGLSKVHPGVGRPGLDALLDALTEALRTPPKDPREVLRRACLEALLDPLAAMLEPRSPLAALRKVLFGATLVTVMMGAGTAMAQTPEVADETIQVDEDADLDDAHLDSAHLDNGELDDDESEVELEPDPDDDEDDDDRDADDRDADDRDADDSEDDEDGSDDDLADQDGDLESDSDGADTDSTDGDESDSEPIDLDEEGKDRSGFGGKTRSW
ncbi:MAG: hypothetical protein AAGF12_16350 [Myxococcota bacterium]